jgi:predicted DNA-binding WGR domain protein
MGYIHLKSVDPAKNRFRSYTVSWGLTLWGTWGVACQWGRIGQNPCGWRLRECADQDAAMYLAAEVVGLRMKHGYMTMCTSGATDDSVDSDEN